MICSECQEDKSPEEFHRQRNGRFPWCKACRRSYDKERHRQRYDSGKKTAQFRANRERNRQFIFGYLQANPCADCGEKDPVVLEFDHLGDKSFNLSVAVGAAWGLDRIQEEIAKCEVVCANCHRRRTARQFDYWILDYTRV